MRDDEQFDTEITLPAGLTPRYGDNEGDPGHCVIANAIRRLYPWAKSPKVGKQEITLYDYRCEHNPSGKIGGCDECPGKGYTFPTPADAADCIGRFDDTEENYDAGDCVFPAINLTNPVVKVSAQDRQRKRLAMADYQAAIDAGVHKPNKRSPQALQAATRRRRSS